MLVNDILLRKGHNIIHVSPDTTVFDAIQLMADHNIGALLVMSGDELKGIITERDYRNKVILKGRTSKQTAVHEIMTSQVFYVEPDEKIENCMAIMTERKFRHLPVVKNQKVVGIISIGDLVKSIIDRQKVVIKDLTAYITGSYPV